MDGSTRPVVQLRRENLHNNRQAPRRRGVCLGATGIPDGTSGKGKDAETLEEAREAPEVEATARERTEETDFDVKSIPSYAESFVKLVAVGAEIGNDMGDRDT